MAGCDYDVIVVGASAGGASAAFFSAQSGQRTLVIEQARFPRHKPCGGAVPQAALRRFPFSFESIIETRPTASEIHYPGQTLARIALDDCPVALFRRPILDAYLLERVAQAGADVLQDVAVTGLTESHDGVEVMTADGRAFAARYLIGADGANSTVARALGLRPRRLLTAALEAEFEPEAAALARWSQTAVWLYGVCPAGYLWLFPKRECFSVGIARFAPGRADLRGIFVQQMARLGLDLSGVELRGHPLPLYRRAERLHTARCLLVGDAAGLVDPLLGEGIRYAIYSAQMAAQAIVQDDLTGYTRRVQRRIGHDLHWAGKAACLFYNSVRLGWEWALSRPSVVQTAVDVLRERRSYRKFVLGLPLYVFRSLRRDRFVGRRR